MTDDLAYFQSEEFRQILKRYEESVQQGHSIYMDADDLADIADYYQYYGRSDDADRAINLALEYNPEAVGPLLYKAREALSLRDFDTARAYAGHIEAVDRQEGLYLYGEILICEGKVEEADAYFIEQAKDIMPDEWTDYVYDVANIFSDYNAFDKAFEWMARSQGDDSDDFKELMARTLFGLGKYKDSERIFNELIDHDPFSIRYWNALANAQFMNEDYQAAITSSEYAIAIDPNDAESLLSKANSLYSLGNYESALEYFRKYSVIMDEDEFGYLHQGTCLINLDRFEEAIQVLEKAEYLAEDDSPYLPEICQELAFAYTETKQPERALYYIDKTKDMDCDHVNMEIIRGHVYLASQRPEEAEEAFKTALRLSDNSQKTMLRIIVSLYDNRYVHTSYVLLKNFFRHVDKDWKEGFSYMALCCMDMKKTDEFLYYLKKAAEVNPKEARTVLGSYFPEGTAPQDYYTYMSNQTKTEQ
ncbi:MAG: tetratricopeptide repeat protein [Prevotella sp.]|nr:tetratricopeptide repeat protein [Prevotella sp.]